MHGHGKRMTLLKNNCKTETPMHYLKCSNCDHLNEVKGEYLTFCANCVKQLDNSFAEWKKDNPKKTFEEYKQSVCIAIDAQTPEVSDNKKKGKGKSFWIFFTATLLVFYLLGNLASEKIVHFLNNQFTSEAIFDQEWVKESYGQFGLSVETPVKMTRENLPLPSNVKQVIDQMDTYKYDKKGFKILINSIKYNASVGQTNLLGAANGSVNEMRNQEGVSHFDYSQEQISKKQLPGFKQQGTYQHNGVDVEFINVGYSKDLNLWQVLAVYQKSDSIGRTAAQRVINSIEIKY